MMQCCKTCTGYAVPVDENGKRNRVTKNSVYPCRRAVALPPLPDSITKHYSFSKKMLRSFMRPDDGKECPTYEARK